MSKSGNGEHDNQHGLLGTKLTGSPSFLSFDRMLTFNKMFITQQLSSHTRARAVNKTDTVSLGICHRLSPWPYSVQHH